MKEDFPILPDTEADDGVVTRGNEASAPLFGLDSVELTARMKRLGEAGFRGKQLAEALYRQRISNLNEITTLPKKLRERLLAEGWQVGRSRIAQVFASSDGTERYLIEGSGGESQTVEAVWMPEDHCMEQPDCMEPSDEDVGEIPAQRDETQVLRFAQNDPLQHPRYAQDDYMPGPAAQTGLAVRRQRATICVSSQVGCAVNCSFCLTARLGWQRNLTAGEIAGQVIAILDRHQVDVGRDRLNLVFMGMGEPFLNYENFISAVRLLVVEAGLSPRRMTVSTSGIVPGIERFALEAPEIRPRLAISLNAPNDQLRGEVMPINRKWPIESVLEAVRRIPLRSWERITFEYVLLGGVTDQPKHAREVARLLLRSGVLAKVNLIAWNAGPGVEFVTPKPEAVESFRETLRQAGVPAYLRQPRGRDIYAACGQLTRTVEG